MSATNDGAEAGGSPATLPRGSGQRAKQAQHMAADYPAYIGQNGVGIVRSVKDSYGFIMPLNSELSQLFFHISEVLDPRPTDTGAGGKPDLRAMLKLNDEVEFTVEPSNQDDGKLHAKKVRVLRSGTLELERKDPVRRCGRCKCFVNGDLYISFTPDDKDMTILSDAMPGGEQSRSNTLKLRFNKSSVLSGGPVPQVDDWVEFCLLTDNVRKAVRATDIEVIAHAPSEDVLKGRSMGKVTQLSEAGGEVREPSGGQLRFGAGDLQPQLKLRRLNVHSEVSFRISESTGQRRATDVALLPPGTINAKQSLGTFRGVVRQMPAGSSEAPQPGSIEYEAASGGTCEAAFTMAEIHEFVPSLEVGDKVEFELVKSRYSPAASARCVTLLLKQSQDHELGCVSMLKKNFGFIKCASRVVDMFFHVNALLPCEDPELRLEVDSEVRFLPTLDQETQRVVASQVQLLPRGSVQFTRLSDEKHEGVVRVAAGVPHGGTPGTSGVVVTPLDGRLETLPFSFGDVVGKQPEADQLVEFRVLEDRKAVALSRKGNSKAGSKVRSGGRRAVEVSLTAAADSHRSTALAAAAQMPLRASDAATSSAEASNHSHSDVHHRRGDSYDTLQQTGSLEQARDNSSHDRNVSKGEKTPVEASLRPAKACKGTVQRVVTRPKRGQPRRPFGILRTQIDSWARKPSGRANGEKDARSGALEGTALLEAVLQDRRLDVGSLMSRDVLFWLDDVADEHREHLARQDEVTGVIVRVPWDGGSGKGAEPLQDDGLEVERAVQVQRVRPAKPSARSAQPSSSAHHQQQQHSASSLPSLPSGGGKRPPKFVGTVAVQVPGPPKDAGKGFCAGRGKPLADPKERVSSFKLEETLSATAFVPRSSSMVDMRSLEKSGSMQARSSPASPCASRLAEAERMGQFDDADDICAA